MRVVPPRNRHWYELLPPPYNRDQKVMVVMQSPSWRPVLMASKDDKYQLGCLTNKDNSAFLGLQVIDTDLSNYMDQREVFKKYGVEMADPAFIGKLSEIPDALLLDQDRAPLVFCLSAMWRNYVDLKRVWKRSELKC